MNRADIKTKLIKVCVEHLGVEESKVTEDADFISDLGCDSLDVIELCMAFEETFNIAIDDHQMDSVFKVSEAIELIESKFNGK